MLTKSDLSAIRDLIRAEMQSAVPSIVRRELKTELKPLIHRVDRIEKKLDGLIHAVTEDLVNHNSRITRIENHLGFPND